MSLKQLKEEAMAAKGYVPDEVPTRPDPNALAVAELFGQANLPLGFKLFEGILEGKRIGYFEGKKALKLLLSPEYQELRKKNKKLPEFKDQEEAVNLLNVMAYFELIFRVERQGRNLKLAHPPPSMLPPGGGIPFFSEDACYALLYEGSQMKTILYGSLVVVVAMAGAMFPLWPSPMRTGVWYLSMLALSLIGALFGLSIIRLIIYGFTMRTRGGFWLFPNLFAEVSILESFRPVYCWGDDYVDPVKQELEVRKQKLKAKEEKEKAKAAQQQAALAALMQQQKAAAAAGGQGGEGGPQPQLYAMGPNGERVPIIMTPQGPAVMTPQGLVPVRLQSGPPPPTDGSAPSGSSSPTTAKKDD